MFVKLESFNMNVAPSGLDPKYLVRVCAKTVGTTDHTKDSSIPAEERVKRIYSKEALAAGARTLSLRPINANHITEIEGAYVVFSHMNEADEIEALCYIPHEGYMRKLKEGFIKRFSIEEVNFDAINTCAGVKLEDIVFTGLALVEPPYIAGDKNSSVKAFYEGMQILCEISGVEDPAVVTPVVVESPTPAVVVPPVVVPVIVALPDPLVARVSELEGAITRLTATVETYKTGREAAVSDAVKEERQHIIEKVEAELPSIMILRQGANGTNRLSQNIKRVLREIANDTV